MKSEERHELKSNELEKFTARVRPIFEQFGLHIVLAISTVVVVAAAVLFWQRTSAAEKTAGWSELIEANSTRTPDQLLEVADNEALSTKPVAAWARLQAAEQLLATGIQLAFEKRSEERGLVSELDEARENFALVLEFAPAGSQMRERALFGLGRCLETMAGVNQRTNADNTTTVELRDKSVEAYDELLTEYPDSPYNQKRYEEEELGSLERHLKRLKSDKALEFYAWFRTQNPQKPDSLGPRDGFPMGHPPIDRGPVRLPQIPDSLRLPDVGSDDGPELPGATTEPDDGDSSEASPAAKPAEGETDKPAASETPTDNKEGE